MSPLDVVVIVAVAAAIGLPYLRSAVGLITWPGAPAKAKALAWRQKWAATLIDFIEEVEAGGGTLERPEQALVLARELVWEVIGGDGSQPPKGK